MFKRKLWRRAVKGKGRLHPDIEETLKALPSWASIQQTGSSFDKTMHLFAVILAMPPGTGGWPPKGDLRIPGTPKAKWGLWSPKGYLADASIQRAGNMINPSVQGQGKQKALLKPRGTVVTTRNKARPLPKGSVGAAATSQGMPPFQYIPARPKWRPPQRKAPSQKSGGHYNEYGVWTSRSRGKQRREWPANKKL